jgi:hypothetical protein
MRADRGAGLVVDHRGIDHNGMDLVPRDLLHRGGDRCHRQVDNNVNTGIVSLSRNRRGDIGLVAGVRAQDLDFPAEHGTAEIPDRHPG